MCDEIKQKMKDTHSKDPDIWKKRNEKLTKTLSKKYGVSNAYNIKRIQDKSLRTKWNDAYDRFELFKKLVIPNFTKDQFVGRNAKEYSWKCVICGHDFNQWIKKSYLNDKIYNIPVCPKCHPYKHDSSIGEIELINFCKDVDNTIEIRNNKLIKPYSLDIVSNTSKVALEFNGLYWHCDKANRDQNYHINKINMCHNIGYDLFQVFENGWYDKQNIIKNYILKLFNKLRTIELSYSDCIHCSVDDNVIISFLKNNFYYSDFVINHMYENYCLLDSNNNVLSIMVIDKNYNIICHCDQLNNIYLNSFEYLYHDVITKHNNCNLKYIVNKNWITLNDITQLNNIFKHNLNTEPILYWTRGVTVINLNDINIVDLLKDKFNPQISENETCI